MKMSLAEILGVTAVGMGLAYVSQKVPTAVENQVKIGAALYLLGYWIAATKRPAGGYGQLTS